MPITVIDQIVPKNAGAFAVAEDTDLKGGFRVVADITARNAIPAGRRKVGMVAHVVALGEDHRWDGSAWQLVTGSGGGGGGGGGAANVVSNYAALALTGIAATQVATVTDPLIAGTFVSRASGAAVNNGTVIAHAQGGSWRWHRQYSTQDGVDPQWFGAVVGSGDSATALQAALNEAAGGVLKLPAGVLTSSIQLTIPGGATGMRIVGVAGRSELNPHASFGIAAYPFIRFSSETGNGTNENLSIEGVTFTGLDTGTPNASLVRIFGAKNFIVRDCTFRDHRRALLSIGGANGAIIASSRFSNWANNPATATAADAVWVGHNSQGGGEQCRDVVVADNRFDNARWTAVANYGHGTRIINNTFRGLKEAAIYSSNMSTGDAARTVIAGNVIEDVTLANIEANGIEAHGPNLVISDNVIRNVAADGIRISGNVRDVVVSGNTVLNCGQDPLTFSGRAAVTMIIGANNYMDPYGITVVGNTFAATDCRQSRGVWINKAGTKTQRWDRVLITGNTFRTPDIIDTAFNARTFTEGDLDKLIRFSGTNVIYTIDDNVIPSLAPQSAKVNGLNVGTGNLTFAGSADLSGTTTVPVGSQFEITFTSVGATTAAVITVWDTAGRTEPLPEASRIEFFSGAVFADGSRQILIANNLGSPLEIGVREPGVTPHSSVPGSGVPKTFTLIAGTNNEITLDSTGHTIMLDTSGVDRGYSVRTRVRVHQSSSGDNTVATWAVSAGGTLTWAGAMVPVLAPIAGHFDVIEFVTRVSSGGTPYTYAAKVHSLLGDPYGLARPFRTLATATAMTLGPLGYLHEITLGSTNHQIIVPQQAPIRGEITTRLRLIQGSGGGKLVTAWTGIDVWAGGAPPTLRTVAGHWDLVEIIQRQTAGAAFHTIGIWLGAGANVSAANNLVIGTNRLVIGANPLVV